MGLKSMQQDLQQSREQESSLITDLTTALEQTKAENSNLTNKLAEAYKRIEKLANSDLQLQKAQLLEQSANAQKENAEKLMKDNEQKSADLQNREQLLKKQQKQLEEQEKNLATTIGAYKTQAQIDAKAELADGWKELEDSKKEAEKEREEARQHIKDLKEEAQRELAAAQTATEKAAAKGYHNAVSNYALVIRFMIFFCGIFGLSEVIKHRYILGVYADWYTWLISRIGFVPAFAVGMGTVGIFVTTYLAPWGDYCNKQEYYLGLAMRLMVLIWLYTMADAVADTTAAVVIYMSCIVVGILRWMVSHA